MILKKKSQYVYHCMYSIGILWLCTSNSRSQPLCHFFRYYMILMHYYHNIHIALLLFLVLNIHLSSIEFCLNVLNLCIYLLFLFFILLCGSRFTPGVIFFVPVVCPLVFLIIQVCWWWFLLLLFDFKIC